MRVLLVSLAGIAASLAAFVVSQLTSGSVGASAYTLALLIAPVTIGLAIALAIDRRLDETSGLLEGPRSLPQRSPISHESRCGGCGREKTALQSVWVCATCDLVPLPLAEKDG